MIPCHRCGAALAAGQEYCLHCGSRRPGAGRFGAAPIDRGRLAASLTALAVIAAAGAASAVWATRENAAAAPVLVALGGSVRAPIQPGATTPGLQEWPDGADGWTVVLAELPKARGRDAAVRIARRARTRGAAAVGVVDSSRYPSLQPGSWVVFAGRFTSESEARATLGTSRKLSRTARVQRIVG